MEFLNPNDVLKQLRLNEKMTAADFGCGSGGWVIPLAKKLEDGKVYAIDVLEEPLSALRAKMKLEKLNNIETIQANVEGLGGSKLDDTSCDLVLMTNLLYQCDDKRAVLEEGKRVLKNKGTILIVDWKKDNPLTREIEKVSFIEIKRIAEELNFKLVNEFDAGAYHYVLILER